MGLGTPIWGQSPILASARSGGRGPATDRRGAPATLFPPFGIGAPAGHHGVVPDETLIKTLDRAHRWRRRIERSQAKSITDLAEQEGVTDAYVCRLLPLTCLAPDIVEAILDGRQPKELRLARCAREWTACLERPGETWGLQQLTRRCSERFGLGAAQFVLKLKQTAGQRESQPACPLYARKQPWWRVTWDVRV
jgi:hypothetical protein